MTANLNVPASYNEMQEMGVVLGRQLGVAFALKHGAIPADRHQASADEFDCIADMEDVLRPIEQRAAGAGSDLAYAFRAFAIEHLSKGKAFTAEMEAHDAEVRAGA